MIAAYTVATLAKACSKTKSHVTNAGNSAMTANQ